MLENLETNRVCDTKIDTIAEEGEELFTLEQDLGKKRISEDVFATPQSSMISCAECLSTNVLFDDEDEGILIGDTESAGLPIDNDKEVKVHKYEGETDEIRKPNLYAGDCSKYLRTQNEECEKCKYILKMGHNTNVFTHSHEPWPKDVKLFQPYEVEQILLPDNANCLAVQTYLKMCGLEYQVEPRANAEAMSPTGKVPFIKCGAYIVAELEGIVQCVGGKGISLTSDLSGENKSDMRAYMTLVHNVLGNAELYICWCENETYSEVTKPRYGSIYPWPLNHIESWAKRNEEIKRLRVLGWYQKSMEDVYNDVETCCQALTDRLDGNEYFFGNKPTELEALIFGHLYTILTTPLPNATLANTVKNFPRLINLITKIEKQFFQRETHH